MSWWRLCFGCCFCEPLLEDEYVAHFRDFMNKDSNAEGIDGSDPEFWLPPGPKYAEDDTTGSTYLPMGFAFEARASDSRSKAALSFSTSPDSVQSETNASYLKEQGGLQSCEISEEKKSNKENKDKLEGQGILLSTSSKEGICCDPIRFRRFDMPLEQFLGNCLLNKTHRCAVCHDSTESHIYHYMHQHGKLTICVKCHSANFSLPGEAEKQLWMWSRCIKCKVSTERVVVSAAARCLPFGKLLELFFSAHSSSTRLPNCGHCICKDYLYFYGLGPMVAMFRYLELNLCTLYMPPAMLEFNKQTGEWIVDEAKKVQQKDERHFSDVGDKLSGIKSSCCSSNSSDQTYQLIEQAEGMLKEERSYFKSRIEEFYKKGPGGCTMHGMLSLNRLVQERGLHTYVWDRRFHFLQSDNKVELQKDDIAGTPFLKTLETYIKNLRENNSSNLLIAGEKFIPVALDDNNFVLVFENEVTSAIASALAILRNCQHSPTSSNPEIHLGGMKSVVCIFEKDFRALREQLCTEMDYITSLSRCSPFNAKGGKSGSVFEKTKDDRFIVKEIQKIEYESFVELAPDYFDYVNQSLTSGIPSCLAKILGVYQIITREKRYGKERRCNLMVMENILYGGDKWRTYDLKGARYGREILSADDDKGYLDGNFVKDLSISPLIIKLETKRYLQRAIWNDTHFLSSKNVMDYSLLVGVNSEKNEAVCGIIDYLRPYTLDKKFESWMKSSFVVPKNVLPTIIAPEEYKKRFRKFMSLFVIGLP